MAYFRVRAPRGIMKLFPCLPGHLVIYGLFEAYKLATQCEAV